MPNIDCDPIAEPKAPAAKPAPVRNFDPFNIFSLMSVRDICTCLQVSRSHWWALVAEGKAPSPAIRGPRLTRWRAADVAAWISSQQGRG